MLSYFVLNYHLTFLSFGCLIFSICLVVVLSDLSCLARSHTPPHTSASLFCPYSTTDHEVGLGCLLGPFPSIQSCGEGSRFPGLLGSYFRCRTTACPGGIERTFLRKIERTSMRRIPRTRTERVRCHQARPPLPPFMIAKTTTTTAVECFKKRLGWQCGSTWA